MSISPVQFNTGHFPFFLNFPVLAAGWSRVSNPIAGSFSSCRIKLSLWRWTYLFLLLMTRTGKFKKKGKCPVLNCTGEIEIDYTEEMVLDNFIRGLSDEEIKSKVFAMQEEDCTPEKVLRFVEAEELGRSSVRDIRPASDVQQISGYMRAKQTHQ